MGHHCKSVFAGSAVAWIKGSLAAWILAGVLIAIASGCGEKEASFASLRTERLSAHQGAPINLSDPALQCAAGGKSIKICHIPPGNPSAQHTICVGLNGAVNGHGVVFDGSAGGHGGDYPGECGVAPPSTDDDDGNDDGTDDSGPDDDIPI